MDATKPNAGTPEGLCACGDPSTGACPTCSAPRCEECKSDYVATCLNCIHSCETQHPESLRDRCPKCAAARCVECEDVELDVCYRCVERCEVCDDLAAVRSPCPSCGRKVCDECGGFECSGTIYCMSCFPPPEIPLLARLL